MICASKSTEKSFESNHLKALCVKECQHQKSITIQKPVSDDDDNDDDDDVDDDDDGDDDGVWLWSLGSLVNCPLARQPCLLAVTVGLQP